MCQGIAQHIKQRPSFFRLKLTKPFSGKQKICTSVAPSKKTNIIPWEMVITDLVHQTSSHLKEGLKSRIVFDFSTTGLKEKTAFEIAFLAFYTIDNDSCRSSP
ncbi:MAG: DUF4419 domain-containing protein [Aureispira sp.]